MRRRTSDLLTTTNPSASLKEADVIVNTIANLQIRDMEFQLTISVSPCEEPDLR